MALFCFASAHWAKATPTYTAGDYSVNGSTVIALRSDTSAGSFYDPSATSYNMTIGAFSLGSTNYLIDINGSGIITNSGSIVGNNFGISIGDVGTVTNLGSIAGTGNFGLSINGMGTVTNYGSIVGGGSFGLTIGSGTVTNHGSILGGGNFGVAIYGAGSLTNTGSIVGSANFGVDIIGAGTVINSGSIAGYSQGLELLGGGTVTNSGSIVGMNGDGLDVSGTGTITNSGSVMGHENGIELSQGTITNSGSIVGSGSFGVELNFGTISNAGSIVGSNGVGVALLNGTVINSGSVTGGSGAGIEAYGESGESTSVILEGGSVSGTTNAVEVNVNSGLASTVTVLGRTRLTYATHGLVSNGATGTLTLELVGATPAEVAALQGDAGHTSGTLSIGGATYDWSNLQLTGASAISLEQVVDPGLAPIATRIDTVGLPSTGSAGAQYDLFYQAALTDPEGALNTLTGRAINNATDAIGVNQATAFTSSLNRVLNDRNSAGAGGFNTSNLYLSPSSLLAFDNTSARLDSLLHQTAGSVLGGTTVSTDEPGIVPLASELRWNAWAAGTVTLADQSTSNVPGYRSTTGSPMLGIDCRVTPALTIGTLLSFSTTGANFSDGSRLGAETGLGGFYATWKQGGWHVNGVAAGGYTAYDIQRSVFGATATSHPGGWEALTDWTGGCDVSLGHDLRFTPELGVTYTHLAVASHNESGAGAFNLNLGQQDIDSLRSHLGGQLAAEIRDGGITFLPEVHAAYYHEFLDDSRGVSESLPGAPALGSFSVNTSGPQRDFALVGAGLNTAFTIDELPAAIFLDYNAQVGQDNYIAHTVDAGLGVSF